jgi:hypothetical protein
VHVTLAGEIKEPHIMSSSPVAPQKKRWGWLLRALLILAALTLVGAWLWPAIEDAREAARRTSCNGQNKIFGLAMQVYHDNHRCFAPAYFADAQGQPAHSWRVILLPFVGAEGLHERYRFEEAWNSPHNRDLADGLPIGMSGVYPCYHCGSDRASDGLHTSHVVVVGPDTVFPGPGSRRMQELTDGTSNTAVFVELSESGIHWMEPRDLNFETMSFKINDQQREGIRSKHPGCALVALADGSVIALGNDTDPQVVKALLTINDGRAVPLP